jgi:hypothetical protein
MKTGFVGYAHANDTNHNGQQVRCFFRFGGGGPTISRNQDCVYITAIDAHAAAQAAYHAGMRVRRGYLYPTEGDAPLEIDNERPNAYYGETWEDLLMFDHVHEPPPAKYTTIRQLFDMITGHDHVKQHI